MIITQTCLSYMLFWKDQSLLVKNKPMKDSWDLVKQVSVFIKFVKLNKLQSSSSLLKPKPLIFRSMLKSLIVITCWYFKMTLLNDSDSSSKNIEKLTGSGGLYILTQTHLLFDIISSEHSEKLSSKSLILLQIIPLLTNIIRPLPPFLSLSRLALIS